MYSFKVLADIRQKYIFFRMTHLTVKKLIMLFSRLLRHHSINLELVYLHVFT